MDKKRIMNKKKVLVVIFGVLGMAIIVLSVILARKDFANIQIGFSGNNIGNELSASFKYFSGSKKKQVVFQESKTAIIKYSLTEESGSLMLKVLDENGNLIDSKEGTVDGEISFVVPKDQKYTIQINAKQAKGKYKLSWSEE
ncbi:hypothetical protein [Anaeromicropila populeti]|uniref:Uncharacterized protein n=1 Tax=Anaeromicropila populeti TaxID=37658 RepID=A0A1I6HIZ7_9FIRM|nr:hypothetical protein [Anaeromicropila populeti]SFR54344.1 hypothetical protein SAMN05661086_00024 [Anaeromicropila populeti]